VQGGASPAGHEPKGCEGRHKKPLHQRLFGNIPGDRGVYRCMKRRISVVTLSLAVAVMAVVAAVEVRHRAVFGHFAPLSLHADVSVAKADLGIPGITKVYEARVTNFGFWPRRVERCEFITDAFVPGVSIGYRLQQLDKSAGRWRTVLDAAANCQPYPLGITQARLTSKLLWPGQTLSTGAEATGARQGLKGETMRFVVVVNGHDLPTTGFTIDEQVQGPDVGYRVRH